MHKHFGDCLEDDPNAIMLEDDPMAIMHEKLNEVRNFKILMIFVFFFICFVGLLPKAWKACARSDTALSLLNCYSSGLFLAMAVVHMLPEGADIYQAWCK